MLYNKEEIEEGMRLWLHPHTKTAATIVYSQAPVDVIDLAGWPWVVVEPSGWIGERMRVHKDDLRKRPPSSTSKQEKRAGDSQVGGTSSQSRRTPIKTAKYDMVLPDGWEEMPLF